MEGQIRQLEVARETASEISNFLSDQLQDLKQVLDKEATTLSKEEIQAVDEAIAYLQQADMQI